MCLHVIVTSRCFPQCTGRTALQGVRACGSMIYGSQLLAARCQTAMVCRDGVNGPWKVYRLTNDDNGSELFEATPGYKENAQAFKWFSLAAS